MAILYICILHRKPFMSIILHVATSNMTGYVGRPDGLLVGEQKSTWWKGQREAKAASTPIRESMAPQVNGPRPLYPQDESCLHWESVIYVILTAGKKSDRSCSGISRLDRAVSEEAGALLQLIWEYFGKFRSLFTLWGNEEFVLPVTKPITFRILLNEQTWIIFSSPLKPVAHFLFPSYWWRDEEA